jgi:hypothetical protein
MNEIELIKNLKYLANKYIYDENVRIKIIYELESTKYDDIGVKGILAEIQACGAKVDSTDSTIIKDIVFNYC